MVTEAQKRANAKYMKENTHSYTLAFFPKDQDIWEHLSAQPKKAEYLRALIRADMERSQG